MKLFLETKDYAVTGEKFTLLLDDEKALLKTEPVPEDLARYYESDAYISHTDARKTLVDKVYQSIKKTNLSRKVKLISRYHSGIQTLLDFGAGTGDFLLSAKAKNWDIAGIEPSDTARARALEKGIDLEKTAQNLKQEKFQIITLWHVLEHIPNIKKQIAELADLLAEEGTLFIAVPNFKSYDAKHYGLYWAAYDVPRHLWHFSRNAIPKLFAESGLKVVDTKPMYFDSFYVSLLSEKYKTGRQRYWSAFWNGLKSNIKAMNSKEYSSIIYILKHKEPKLD